MYPELQSWPGTFTHKPHPVSFSCQVSIDLSSNLFYTWLLSRFCVAFLSKNNKNNLSQPRSGHDLRDKLPVSDCRHISFVAQDGEWKLRLNFLSHWAGTCSGQRQPHHNTTANRYHWPHPTWQHYNTVSVLECLGTAVLSETSLYSSVWFRDTQETLLLMFRLDFKSPAADTNKSTHWTMLCCCLSLMISPWGQSVCVCKCACVRVWMLVCACVCVCVCLHAFVLVCIYACTWTCVWAMRQPCGVVVKMR